MVINLLIGKENYVYRDAYTSAVIDVLKAELKKRNE